MTLPKLPPPPPSLSQDAELELRVLRQRHETLGVAYRGACEELVKLRKEVEGLKARLGAVRVLCEVVP
jgi:hypothetical protein